MIFEIIGSIILLIIDPNRRGNKKYLKPEFSKIKRINRTDLFFC